MRKRFLLILVPAVLVCAVAWVLLGRAAQTAAPTEATASEVCDASSTAEDTSAPQTSETEASAAASFRSPEDILFVSHSVSWDEEKLRALYEELLLNRHGEELKSLSRVTVYGEENELFEGEYDFNIGQIRLFGGDTRTTVEDMASVLSHEYGHHYTFSYMLPGSGSEPDLQSEYARLRALTKEDVLFDRSDPEFYSANHRNYLCEIAAEDYVVLMGSPNAMGLIGDYADVRDNSEGKYDDRKAFRSAAPQENMFLPFAANVPGLADYFYSFLGESAPDYPDASGLELEFIRRAEGRKPNQNVSYKITWNKVLGEDAVYTLVCLDPEQEILDPVKTIRPGEKAEAEIGTVLVWGTSPMYYQDGRDKGNKRFFVVVILPDGRAAVSEPVDRRF